MLIGLFVLMFLYYAAFGDSKKTTSDFYRSSTEANDYCAILWRGVNVPTDKNTKIYKMHIRAAAAF